MGARASRMACARGNTFQRFSSACNIRVREAARALPYMCSSVRAFDMDRVQFVGQEAYAGALAHDRVAGSATPSVARL